VPSAHVVPFGLEQAHDVFAMVALEHDHAAFARAAGGKALLQVPRQLLGLVRFRFEASHDGHGLAVAARIHLDGQLGRLAAQVLAPARASRPSWDANRGTKSSARLARLNTPSSRAMIFAVRDTRWTVTPVASASSWSPRGAPSCFAAR